MLPWIHLDTAAVPGGGELKLMKRGSEFSIMAGSNTLMNSRMFGSEVALARLACEHLRPRHNASLLIGGYGMGFTLRAALAQARADTQMTVVELVPAVLQWAAGPMAALTADGLSDPRVTTHQGDVADVIAAARARFDAILLDVDNGPDGLGRTANDRLYGLQGLQAARRALKAGGLLAVWSAAPDARFAGRLQQAGFTVTEIKSRAHGDRGGRHVIFNAIAL